MFENLVNKGIIMLCLLQKSLPLTDVCHVLDTVQNVLCRQRNSRQSFEDGDGVWYHHVIDNETETGLAKLSKVNEVINDRERNAKPHAFYNYFISSSYIHGPIKFSC